MGVAGTVIAIYEAPPCPASQGDYSQSSPARSVRYSTGRGSSPVQHRRPKHPQIPLPTPLLYFYSRLLTIILCLYLLSPISTNVLLLAISTSSSLPHLRPHPSIRPLSLLPQATLSERIRLAR